MKLIFLVISVILSLMLAPPLLNAFAASDQEHYSAGWRDGENTAQSDFNSGVQYQTADTHCADHHTKQYCSGYWAGYADEWNRSIQANSHTEKTPNPASNPPASNSILNPPTTTSSPTTYSWVGPFIIFVIVVVIIAKIAHKIKHRKGKYRERQYFSESVKENILDKQHHKCAHCNRLLNVVDYDHKDGDRSNNKESNCVALCPNCHAVKTRSTR